MSEVDKVRLSATSAIERSRERRRPIGTKSVALRRQHLYKKLGRVLIAGGIVLIGAAVFGALIQPLGFTGLLALFVLLIGVAVLFGKWPPFPEPRQQDLPKADLKQLAGRTEIWLEAQRPALPAPARQLVDGIGVQLDLLAMPPARRRRTSANSLAKIFPNSSQAINASRRASARKHMPAAPQTKPSLAD